MNIEIKINGKDVTIDTCKTCNGMRTVVVQCLHSGIEWDMDCTSCDQIGYILKRKENVHVV